MPFSLKVTRHYENRISQVVWHGDSLPDPEEFDKYLQTTVIRRLADREKREEVLRDLKALATTGMASDVLETFIAIDEDFLPWEVGEAIAESILEDKEIVRWPWNIQRDKRHPRASLPGADMVGFFIGDAEVLLAFGEVKTSEEDRRPPQVLTGRSGLIHQLDNLANDTETQWSLICWLHSRCKGTEYWDLYQKAVSKYLESNKKKIILFGFLMRKCTPNELDIKNRGEALAARLEAPVKADLSVWYFPRSISSWPQIVKAKPA